MFILFIRFRDGTPPFLEMLSLKYGFKTLAKLTVTMDLISQHTFCLAHFVYNKLNKLQHHNGKKACLLYSDTEYKSFADQGPIINFNLLRSSGDYIGYSEVRESLFLHFVFISLKLQVQTLMWLITLTFFGMGKVAFVLLTFFKLFLARLRFWTTLLRCFRQNLYIKNIFFASVCPLHLPNYCCPKMLFSKLLAV